MTYWKLGLQITSPVHIGAGDAEIIGKNGYVLEKDGRNNLVYFVNETKFALWLNRHNQMELFTGRLMRGDRQFSLYFYFLDYCRNDRNKLRSLLQELVQDGVLTSPVVAEVTVGNSKDRKNSLNDIHRAMRDSEGRLYIPGSSFKGMLRTAILYGLIDKSPEKQRYWKEFAEGIRRSRGKAWEIKRASGDVAGRIEEELLIPKNAKGKHDMVNSLMRYIQVSDSTPCRKGSVIVQKADFGETEDRPHTISVWRECIVPGDEVFFTIGIDAEKTAALGISDGSDIKTVLKNFTEHQLDVLYDSWGDLKVYKTAEKEVDVFLGGGSGYLNKTITYGLAPNIDQGVEEVSRLMKALFSRGHHGQGERMSPHTLKLAKRTDGDQCMGMAKITTIEELKQI